MDERTSVLVVVSVFFVTPFLINSRLLCAAMQKVQ